MGRCQDIEGDLGCLPYLSSLCEEEIKTQSLKLYSLLKSDAPFCNLMGFLLLQLPAHKDANLHCALYDGQMLANSLL